MAETARALKRLQKRTTDLDSGYRKTVKSTLGRYAKAAKEVFDRSIQRQSRLLEVRQAEEAVLQRDRESFFLATRNVLSKDTLDYLRGLSNIAAPTLTSIFTGYESARADEAAREERLLDEREESIARLQRDRETVFREAGQADRSLLSAEGKITDSVLSSAGRTFSESGANERLVAKEVIDAEQSAIGRTFSRDERLAREKTAANVAKEQREFSQKQQEDRQAATTEERLAREKFDRAMAKARTAEQRQQIQLRHDRTMAEIRARAENPSGTRRKGDRSQFIFSRSGDFGGAPSVTPQQATNAAYVVNKLTDLGWSRNQAVGIAANIQQESSFDPSAVGDGGKAFGLAQWHPDRQAEFQKRFGKPIQQSSIDEQIAFINFELREGNEQRAGKLISQTLSPREAAAVVAEYYERPKDIVGESERRGALAETLSSQIPIPEEKEEAPVTQKIVEKQAEQSVEPPPEEPETEEAPDPTPGQLGVTDIQQTFATQDNEQEIQQLQETVAEFEGKEDTTEALRLAAQERFAQSEQLQQQLAAISENPTIEEMQTVFDESKEEDERLRLLLAAAQHNQSLLNQGGVS